MIRENGYKVFHRHVKKTINIIIANYIVTSAMLKKTLTIQHNQIGTVAVRLQIYVQLCRTFHAVVLRALYSNQVRYSSTTQVNALGVILPVS